MPEAVGPTQGQQVVANMANRKQFRAFIAFYLTGAFGSATAFLSAAGNLFDANGIGGITRFLDKNKIDAASYTPYNNLLASNMQPQFRFYPKSAGLYIGGSANPDVEVERILRENSTVLLRRSSDKLMDHVPAVLLPSGLALRTGVATDLSGERVFSETSGAGFPVGLHPLANGMTLDTTLAITVELATQADALAYLAGLPNVIPANRKLVIGLELYGDIDQKVGVDY